jgi:hypothetical protein
VSSNAGADAIAAKLILATPASRQRNNGGRDKPGHEKPEYIVGTLSFFYHRCQPRPRYQEP